MVDYARLSATATRLITKNGRQLTLVRYNENAADSDEPWNGPPPGGTTELNLYGAFVPPNSVRQFGLQGLGQGTEFVDLLTHSEQIVIVNPEDNDVREYSAILDEGVSWGILGTQVLRPGPTTVLAFIGVRR